MLCYSEVVPKLYVVADSLTHADLLGHVLSLTALTSRKGSPSSTTPSHTSSAISLPLTVRSSGWQALDYLWLCCRLLWVSGEWPQDKAGIWTKQETHYRVGRGHGAWTVCGWLPKQIQSNTWLYRLVLIFLYWSIVVHLIANCSIATLVSPCQSYIS